MSLFDILIVRFNHRHLENEKNTLPSRHVSGGEHIWLDQVQNAIYTNIHKLQMSQLCQDALPSSTPYNSINCMKQIS